MSNKTSAEVNFTDDFMGPPEESTKAAKALAFAMDNRKFEIELYWKRATYFWAFTGVAFAGYLTVLTARDINDRPTALLLVSCLGLVFAIAWYFVNRASKFWQANWEAHVDTFEDKVMGPIYKTVLKEQSSIFNISASYPFSVTKINQLLSLFVVLVFAGLVGNTLNEFPGLICSGKVFPLACLILTFLAIIALFVLGKTTQTSRNIAFNRRTTSNDGNVVSRNK